MRIYIAASWARRVEARALARLLRDDGHEIVATWLTFDGLDGPDSPPEPYDQGDEAMARFSEVDLEDVGRGEGFVMLNGDRGGPGGNGSQGGKFGELGKALTLDKKIWIVGPPESIHCRNRRVTAVADVAALRRALQPA